MVWDKKVNYEEIEKKLKTNISDLVDRIKGRETKSKPHSTWLKLHLGYNSILLTQLSNGARISEAVEGVVKFMENSNREQRVRTRKRVKTSSNKTKMNEFYNQLNITLGEELVEKIKKVAAETIKDKPKKNKVGKEVDRLIIIPTSIKSEYFDGIKHKTTDSIKEGTILYAINHLHINTHSLRYALISAMGREKIPSHLISGLIRHSSTETIKNYTREDDADDILRGWVK